MLAVRASRMLESGRLALRQAGIPRSHSANGTEPCVGRLQNAYYEKAGSHVNIDTEILQKKKAGYTVGFRTAARSYDGPDITAQCVITGGPGTARR